MINTSKYDGHLPFAGNALERIWVWSKSGMNRMVSVEQYLRTARLIEDAPALLAEVMRLRQVIDDALQFTIVNEELEQFLKQQGYISVTPNEIEDEQQ